MEEPPYKDSLKRIRQESVSGSQSKLQHLEKAKSRESSISSNEPLANLIDPQSNSSSENDSDIIHFLDRSLDINEWFRIVSQCEILDEQSMYYLCQIAKSRLKRMPNIVDLRAPIKICGDIHGQFYDLVKLFSIGGAPPDTKYVFMGDYVDRGHHSIETFTYLLIMMVRWPDHIILLRGNHESALATHVYGFRQQCNLHYGDDRIWRMCCEVFNFLPIGALIDGTIFCVHGGLSPKALDMGRMFTIYRACEIPDEGPFTDLMWSDPREELVGWASNKRSRGTYFGRDVTEKFMKANHITLICRGHELVMNGIKYIWDDKLCTVWSVPNYCYRCGNIASILEIHEDGQRTVQLFKESIINKFDEEIVTAQIPPYFQ